LVGHVDIPLKTSPLYKADSIARQTTRYFTAMVGDGARCLM
jgi:hypothetical protein